MQHIPSTNLKGSVTNANRVDAYLVNSFGSNDSGYGESSSLFSSNASTPCSSPVKKHPHLDIREVNNDVNRNNGERRRDQVHLPFAPFHAEDDEISSEDFLNSFAGQGDEQQRQTVSHEDRRSQGNYPDMIPSYEHHQGCKPFTISWSPFPDLVPSRGPYYQDDEEDDEDLYDFEKSLNHFDGNEGGLVPASLHESHNWSKLGAQLCDIANRFETTFYEPSTDQQRAVYQAFQRIRLSCILANGRHTDNTLSGLAKTICRQFLLSSIWILLKKVL